MRILISSLICAVLGVAGLWAIRHGAAGEQYHASARKLWDIRRQAYQSGKPPDAATLAALETNVARTLEATPTHGALWLNQALIARTGRLNDSGAVVENLSLARTAMETALVNQPQSPIMWGEYAVLGDLLHSQKQLEGGTARLNQLMRRALTLAPREASVQLSMWDLGWRNWDELEPATRAALEQALGTFNAQRQAAVLRLAERRGRVDEACALPALRAALACIAKAAEPAPEVAAPVAAPTVAAPAPGGGS